MAKQFEIDRLYTELDKITDKDELADSFELIKDFCLKKLNSEKNENLSNIEAVDEVIKKINGN